MLKKRILIVLFVCTCIAGFAVNGISSSRGNGNSPVYTMARICIWPNELYWPKNIEVHGLSLGVPATCGQGERVMGLDLALLFCTTQNVRGVQLSPFNFGSNIRGWQVAFANLSQDVDGLQVGLFNKTVNDQGMQFGIVNYSKKTTAGIQIGIINIMKNGFLPVFPFFNFALK